MNNPTTSNYQLFAALSTDWSISEPEFPYFCDANDEVIEHLDVSCSNCESYLLVPCVISDGWEDKEIAKALHEEIEAPVCDNCADYLDDRGLDYDLCFTELERYTDLNPFVLYRYEEPELDDEVWLGEDR